MWEGIKAYIGKCKGAVSCWVWQLPLKGRFSQLPQIPQLHHIISVACASRAACNLMNQSRGKHP
jgi:hypothetical protein